MAHPRTRTRPLRLPHPPRRAYRRPPRPPRSRHPPPSRSHRPRPQRPPARRCPRRLLVARTRARTPRRTRQSPAIRRQRPAARPQRQLPSPPRGPAHRAARRPTAADPSRTADPMSILRTPTPRHLASAFAAALLVLLATHAHAFVRTMTCTPPGETGGTLTCRDGEQPLPLYWDAPCIGYHVHQDGLETLGPETTHEQVHRSFATWNDVPCSWLRLVPRGLTDEDRVGYDACGSSRRNANVVLFREDQWRAGDSAPIIALTSVTYIVRTGEILDADIEVNAAHFDVGIVENPFTSRHIVDLQNALTHEIGHLLGLDHTSPDDRFVGDPDTWQEAAMHALTRPGETRKRTLHEDDIAGVCDIYPADVGHPDGDCRLDPTPDGFFVRPSGELRSSCPDDRACGCTATPNHSHGPPALLLLVALLALRRRTRPL
ncbi:MAG: hypothetical protein EA398_00700 [Deltaproteobacteria bacterium]|nr:MAG: hypothetical protein EA398_00700 [Deltaproteobacteria bacterium]